MRFKNAKPVRKFIALVYAMSALSLPAAGPRTEPVIDRVIRAADKNKDGRIQFEEFKLLDVQARNHADEHFARGDADKNGYLDRKELTAELAKKQTWFVILCEGVEASFARHDINKDNKLDPKEYRKVSRMGGHATHHHRNADTNKDGFLDLTEFRAHAEAKLKFATNPVKKRKRKQ